MGIKDKLVKDKLVKTAKEEDITTKKIHSLMEDNSNGYPLKFRELPTEDKGKIETCKYLHHIKKIDNVPVDVRLTCSAFFSSHNKKYILIVELIIESKDIFCCNVEKNMKYYDEIFRVDDIPKLTIYGANAFIFESIVEILNLFPLLKFDKFNGRFTKNKEYIHFDDLFKFENTECTESAECSVCYELTKSKTPCNHYLCFACNENIPTKFRNSNYEMVERNCPICRKNIIFYEDEDENENEDDS